MLPTFTLIVWHTECFNLLDMSGKKIERLIRIPGTEAEVEMVNEALEFRTIWKRYRWSCALIRHWRAWLRQNVDDHKVYLKAIRGMSAGAYPQASLCTLAQILNASYR